MTGCISNLPSCSGETQRVFNETPIGVYDCVNVDFSAAQAFEPSSLIIRLDGITLDPAQYIINGDNQSFTLSIDAANPKALNAPPHSDESLRIDYNPLPMGSCITFL